MKTELITDRIWLRLTRAARSPGGPAYVAVAYFGKGAANLLSLRSGSHLVVDASEQAVRCGQTCPADLLTLANRGVRVFSVANLHAKVYVFDRRVFVGSANVSRRSANILAEAMVLTTDAVTVRNSRKFVRSHCLHELGPKRLKTLLKIYRPPQIFGESVAKAARGSQSSTETKLPPVFLEQLENEDLSESDDSQREMGTKAARRHRKHSRQWAVDSFQWGGDPSIQTGDIVVMVTEEASGVCLVSPPGTVIHIRRYRGTRGVRAFVYVELPQQRRRRLEKVAKRLGRGAKNRLSRNGVLRRDLAEALLTLWQV